MSGLLEDIFLVKTRHFLPLPDIHLMSENPPLPILVELRQERAPRLSQTAVAKFFGLTSSNGRKTVLDWEKGNAAPAEKHRSRFIIYLLDDRMLRREKEKFEEVWDILATAWGWQPLTESERREFNIAPPVTVEPPTATTKPVLTNVATPSTTVALGRLSQHIPQMAELDDFVGRQEWVARYSSQLASSGTVWITGMAGTGKSMLANYLARQHASSSERLFWYAFHAAEQEDGIDAMLKRLAYFLAQQGHDALLRTLHAAEQHNRLPPLQILLDELLAACHGQNYLIYLDDVHHVSDNPRADLLLQRLQTAAANGLLKLILTTRQLPRFTQTSAVGPLGGLSWAETRQLWQRANAPVVVGNQLEMLWQRIDGHPKTLVLAIEWLRKQGDLAQLLTRPLDTDNIRAYLLDEVNAAFTPEERQIMKALAILPRASGTHALLEAMVDQDIYLILLDLARRHLLTLVQGEDGPEYRQHAIVQAFYDNLLFWRDRLVLHQRAGTYFTEENREILTATEHFIKAREQDRAAALIGDDPRELLNRGQGRRLLRLIEQLDLTKLATALQANVHITRSSAALALGNTTMAEEAIHRGWMLLPEEPTPGHIRALTNLSTLHGQQGQIAQAILAAKQGIEFSQQLQDFSRLPDLLSNLGNCHEMSGAWQEAVTLYEQALDATAQLGGSPHQVVQLKNNLGILLTNQGHYPAAHNELLAAQQLADRLLLKDYQVSILVSLADLYIRWENLPAAKAASEEAHQVAKEIGAEGQLPEIFTCYAEIKFLQGDLQTAHHLAKQAVDLAGDEINQGKALRLLGQVLRADSKLDAAQTTLQQSLALVTDERYEFARTQMQLGACLLQQPDKRQAIALLESAQEAFNRLGATKDQIGVTQFLASHGSQTR